jgi:NAD(P)-dependent dehydrogenase (short-subunit alcohol dehydrogenase family)
LVCDVTESAALRAAVRAGIERFGGLDHVVSNAGDFPLSQALDAIDDADWERSMALNLSSHVKLLRETAPFLKLGIDPSVVVVASRNVPAPGPGVAAYSAAKAGLTQIGRVAALELAPAGVRVNVIHPDKVFDTRLWSDAKLQARADHYGVDVSEYRTRNLLGREVRSTDVASAVLALLDQTFACTTGAQIPIDGGSDRVV